MFDAVPISRRGQLATVEGLVAHSLFIRQADKGVIGAADAIIEKYPTVHMHRVDDSRVSEAELKERVASYDGWTVSTFVPLELPHSHFGLRCLTAAAVDHWLIFLPDHLHISFPAPWANSATTRWDCRSLSLQAPRIKAENLRNGPLRSANEW